MSFPDIDLILTLQCADSFQQNCYVHVLLNVASIDLWQYKIVKIHKHQSLLFHHYVKYGLMHKCITTYCHTKSQLVSVLHIVIELPLQDQNHRIPFLVDSEWPQLLYRVLHRVDQRERQTIKRCWSVTLSLHRSDDVRDRCCFLHDIFPLVPFAHPRGRVVVTIGNTDVNGDEGTKGRRSLVLSLDTDQNLVHLGIEKNTVKSDTIMWFCFLCAKII